MPKLVLRTAEGVLLEHELAGAGSRATAVILDALIVGLPLFAITLLVALLARLDPTGVSGMLSGVLTGGGLVVFLLVEWGFLVSMGGRSPGKRVMGLAVLSADGDPPSAGALFVRTLFLPIEGLVPIPLALGMTVITLSPRRQRLGDLGAMTVVVRVRERAHARRPEPAWSALTGRSLPLEPAMAARFDQRDLVFLRDLYGRLASGEGESERAVVLEAARHYAGRLGVREFGDARQVVRELYLFLAEMRRT